MKKYIYIVVSLFLIIACEKSKSNNEYKIKDNIFLIKPNYARLNFDQKEIYLDSFYNTLFKYNDSLKKQLLFDIAAEYSTLKLNNKSLKVSKEALNLSKKTKDSFYIGRALYYIGDCFIGTRNDSAFYYYKESEKIYKKIKNKKRLAKVYYNKANLLFFEGNYTESEIEISKALINQIGSKDYENIFFTYSLQGRIHTELEEYSKALNCLNSAKDNLNKAGLPPETFEYYNYYLTMDICNVYDKQNKYNKSIIALSNITTQKLKNKWPVLYGVAIGNLAYSKMKSGKLNNVENYINEALSIFNQYKEEKSTLYKTNDLAEYNFIIGDSLNSKKLFEKALVLGKKLKNGKEVLKTLDFLSKIDKKKSDFYKSEYIHTNDSISKKQRLIREKYARIEYETSKVENENKVLTKKNLFLLISSIGIGFILLSIIFYKQIKAQKREFILLEEKKKAEKEIYQLFQDQQLEMLRTREREQNRIAKELHDGVMNQIYGVRLNLGMLNGFDEEEIKEKRLYYIEMLQKIEGEIREISHDLHGENKFEEIDFKSILEELTHSQNNLSRTIFESEIDPTISWDAISSIIKINIYRIAQELFQNTLKYANAAKCTFKITQSENELLIEVKDDGVGFNSDEAKNGIGYKNIRERIGTINGTIKLNTEINKGTEVTIKVLI